MIRHAIFSLLFALASLAPAAETAPATQPATRWNELAIEKKKASFSFEQDGKTIEPDEKGVIHLKAKAFAILVAGDRKNFSFIASRDSKIFAELKKHPEIVTNSGFFMACPDTELFIEDEPLVVFPIDDIKSVQAHWTHDLTEAEEYARDMLKKMNWKVFTLMFSGRQCLKEDDAESFNIGNFFVGEDTVTIKAGEKLELVFFLDTPFDENHYRTVWKSVRVEIGPK